MPTTPNMGLLLPIPTVTPGPTYASENNDAFDLIDSHDHSPGKGVPVSSNGININADLTFQAFNATNLRSAQFVNNGAPLSLPGDITAVYVANGNLFYNNQLGQQVQITNGASLNATVIGGIGGDYTTSTALEFYTALTRTFTFWSAPNVPANLDAGSVTIREIALSPHGITISSPSALAADYTLTLPSALPVSNSAISVDPTGLVTFSGGVTPIGGMVMYGGAVAPSGWLLCDGTSYLRTAFPALFTAIGTAYGSADGTHFNIPDFRGIFPRGVDAGAGNDPDTLTRIAANSGGNTGDNVGSYQLDQFASHIHDPAHALITTANPTANFPNAGGSGAFNSPVAAGGNETRPKNLYVQFIIKT